MEEGAIRGKNRRLLIILTVLMCLVAVAILVIAVIMFSRKELEKEGKDKVYLTTRILNTFYNIIP